MDGDRKTLRKQLEGVLYSMGKTFDKLSLTRLATAEFLRTGNTRLLTSRSDYYLLQDLKDSSSFVLDYDYRLNPFDTGFLQQVSAHITRSGSMYPGVWRDNPGGVGTPLGTYTPEPVDPDKYESFMREADEKYAGLESAARLFLQLSKAQPFDDGNKRTAALAANGLRIKHGETTLLSVPADDEAEVKTFIDLMSRFYFYSDEAAVTWLTDWNQSKQGMA